jgi:hypothetical protein
MDPMSSRDLFSTANVFINGQSVPFAILMQAISTGHCYWAISHLVGRYRPTGTSSLNLHYYRRHQTAAEVAIGDCYCRAFLAVLPHTHSTQLKCSPLLPGASVLPTIKC